MKFRSTMFAELRGSMAGLTAARNKGGNYLRARATPTNPDSFAQQQVRQAFAYAVAEWNGLTTAERQAWEAYAQQTPITDSLGTEIRHSGRSWYIAQAAFRERIGETAVAAAPITPGLIALGEPTGLSLSVADGVNAAFPNWTGVAGDSIVQIGPPVANGVTYFKGPYTFAATAADATFVDVPVVSMRYGALALGERRPVRFKYADDNGKMSNTFETIVTVVA
jgi:hypothetical protein